MKPEDPHPVAARAAVRNLTASKIRELVNAGFGRKDVLPFWVGEPDEPTPEFIRRAGIASIEAGEVFYSHNLGIPYFTEPQGPKTLIVDDIADTGETLTPYKNYTIVTLFYHRQSVVVPSIWLHEKTDRYIVFPWEKE